MQQVNTHSLFPPLSGTLACMISRCTMKLASMAMRCLAYDRMGGMRIMRLVKRRGNLIFAHCVCFHEAHSRCRFEIGA